MKRYKVNIEKVKITKFEVDARNKKNAYEIVQDIIFNTNILNLGCVEHKLEVRLDIKPKGDSSHETNC